MYTCAALVEELNMASKKSCIKSELWKGSNWPTFHLILLQLSLSSLEAISALESSCSSPQANDGTKQGL